MYPENLLASKPWYLLNYIISGRLLCGFISDCKCVNRLVLFSTALTTGGIVTIGSIFAHDSWGLAVYAVIYGLAIGK